MADDPTHAGQIPLIDISALVRRVGGASGDSASSPGSGAQSVGDDGDGVAGVASAIGRACREVGFFYVVGHGVPQALVDELFSVGKRFFAEPEEYKRQIHMRQSRVFRGWFELYGELTSGIPDVKEGLYLGAELGDDHPLVQRKTPMHGANQWPDERYERLRPLILAYMAALTQLGHTIMAGVALSLGLPETYFRGSSSRRGADGSADRAKPSHTDGPARPAARPHARPPAPQSNSQKTRSHRSGCFTTRLIRARRARTAGACASTRTTAC